MTNDAVNNYGGTVIDSTVWGYANSNGYDRYCREILFLLAELGGDPCAVSPFPSGHTESDRVIRACWTGVPPECRYRCLTHYHQHAVR